MTRNRHYSVVVRGDAEQLLHIQREITGNRQLHLEDLNIIVSGDNGVTAFACDGPAILEALKNSLPSNLARQLLPWEQLSLDDREYVLGLAAGSIDWAMGETPKMDYSQGYTTADDLPATMLRAEAKPLEHTMILTGKQESIARLLAAAAGEDGIKATMVEATPDGAYARYSHGPLILSQLARATGRSITRWEELTAQEQQDVVSAAARNAGNGCHCLDSQEAKDLMERLPQLAVPPPSGSGVTPPASTPPHTPA